MTQQLIKNPLRSRCSRVSGGTPGDTFIHAGFRGLTLEDFSLIKI
jgi:hypothetical protein